MPARGPTGGRALCTPTLPTGTKPRWGGDPRGLCLHGCRRPQFPPPLQRASCSGSEGDRGKDVPSPTPPMDLACSPIPWFPWQRLATRHLLQNAGRNARREPQTRRPGGERRRSADECPFCAGPVQGFVSIASLTPHPSQARNPLLSHFTDEATEAQGKERPCPGSYSQSVAESGFELRFPWIPSPGLYSLLSSWPGLSCSGWSSAMGPTDPWVNPFTSPRLCRMGW